MINLLILDTMAHEPSIIFRHDFKKQDSRNKTVKYFLVGFIRTYSDSKS